MKVLLAVDSTAASVVALEEYSRRIHSPDKDLLLVHICQTKTSNDDIREGGSQLVLERLLSGEERAKEIKNAFVESAAKKRINIFGFKIFMIDEKEPIGAKIVSCAHSEGCDLIVIGTGKPETNRPFGSTSDYIVHHSWVPVMICPVTVNQKQSE